MYRFRESSSFCVNNHKHAGTENIVEDLGTAFAWLRSPLVKPAGEFSGRQFPCKPRCVRCAPSVRE
jgi:hypothetical protein